MLVGDTFGTYHNTTWLQVVQVRTASRCIELLSPAAGKYISLPWSWALCAAQIVPAQAIVAAAPRSALPTSKMHGSAMRDASAMPPSKVGQKATAQIVRGQCIKCLLHCELRFVALYKHEVWGRRPSCLEIELLSVATSIHYLLIRPTSLRIIPLASPKAFRARP